MTALRYLLVEPTKISTDDFTLSNWAEAEKLAANWETATGEDLNLNLSAWNNIVPTLDIWLEAPAGEFHFVRDLLPTLNWRGGLLGVRLRFEPKDIQKLHTEYIKSVTAARTTRAAQESDEEPKDRKLTLWPDCLRSFLNRKLHQHFSVHYYVLDPEKFGFSGSSSPQSIADDREPLATNPLQGLLRIDIIAAQRGLADSGDYQSQRSDEGVSTPQKRLSEQLRSYYAKHLDPSEFPEPADLDALEAIEASETSFDERLEKRFASALQELSTLNYPGVLDPVLKLSSRLKPMESLNHRAAVQFEVLAPDKERFVGGLRLPEEFNGLGYQNLISIVFQLMSFRDAWMCVGKAEKAALSAEKQVAIPRLHLVLIEEPEAYLHPQVQQVFVRQAYKILRKHSKLGESDILRTQLVVSTHSSHVAHETEFSSLRYFRRLPGSVGVAVPTTTVINLSEVFGADEETPRFVARYLTATHAELFFADAAILVEGAAERMLVPHFIKTNSEFLHRSYITILPIGGSHAHRFRPLIDKLGLLSLVVTDLDAGSAEKGHAAVLPETGCGQVTNNSTLKEWWPKHSSIDVLLALDESEKTCPGILPLSGVRVAYQNAVSVTLKVGERPHLCIPSTFEDSMALENYGYIKETAVSGALMKKFKAAISTSNTAPELSEKFFKAVRTDGVKAEFSLDLLMSEDGPEALKAPTYILNGLKWLEDRLKEKKAELLLAEAVSISGG